MQCRAFSLSNICPRVSKNKLRLSCLGQSLDQPIPHFKISSFVILHPCIDFWSRSQSGQCPVGLSLVGRQEENIDKFTICSLCIGLQPVQESEVGQQEEKNKYASIIPRFRHWNKDSKNMRLRFYRLAELLWGFWNSCTIPFIKSVRPKLLLFGTLRSRITEPIFSGTQSRNT